MERIGIFGGTFDPPHLAHLTLAAEAFRQLNLTRLLWVLTPDPPHKPGRPITPLALRLEMLQAALAGRPEYQLSRVEIDRPPPHYAAETVRLLRAEYPWDFLIYLMGGDSLRDLTQWHQPDAFLRGLDSLGVMRRPGAGIDFQQLEARFPGVGGKILWVRAPLSAQSSSAIREAVRSGKPVDQLIPQSVGLIIEREKLYRA